MNSRFRILNTVKQGIRQNGKNRSSQARRKGHQRHLVLEPLEARLLLSATVLDTSKLANISMMGKATVEYSGMMYNRRTLETSLNASVTNSSNDTMPATLYLVVDSWMPANAEFANADGLTLDGRPYYVLDPLPGDTTAAFTPGEVLEKEKLILTNTGRARIDLSASVYAVPVELELNQGLSSLSIPLGESSYVAFGISTLRVDGYPVDVQFTQTIQPDNGGISLSSDYPSGGWVNLSDTTRVVNEFVQASSLGSYTVTSTATIPSLGISQSTELMVTVYDPDVTVAFLWAPGAEPDSLQIGTTTSDSLLW
jgi:hypothetical protein